MKPVTVLTLMAILTLPLAADGPKGTVPRSSPQEYAAHAEVGGVAIGATLLTPKEVRKAFTTDLTRCCRVVEVALYPAEDSTMDVSLGDFVLRIGGTDTTVKASSPLVLAEELQKKNSNDMDAAKAGGVHGEVHAGYEMGTDPATGQRIHGVDSGGSVSIGNPGPGPASNDHDRYLMEMELTEKGLPEDTVSSPVAGYLYFSVSKDNRKATHELEYTLNGQKVALKLD